MKKFIKRADLILSAICLVIFSLIVGGQYFLPESVCFYDGKTETDIYAVFHVAETKTDIVSVSTVGSENCTADVSLFGIIPVGKVNAEKTERKYVHVGGDVIGIRLYTDGILVVSTDDVVTADGNVNPGEMCGIQAGDMILEINDEIVCSVSDFSNAVISCGGNDVSITVLRNNEKLYFSLTPVYSETEGKYRCGLWLRDSTAGIGTLTFADPKTNMFASLGHAICDSETQSVLPVGDGDILSAAISGVTRGEKGTTGQIKGNFGNEILGELTENNEFGVYGIFSDTDILYGDLLPVASQTEIETGEAQILCNVDGSGTECYDIEIEKITYSNSKTSRSMVIEVTDPNLLSVTGGIIQGMSGSPIIQNGMLVGAVTHVFLNDPTRGYGIFAETMVSEAERICNAE